MGCRPQQKPPLRRGRLEITLFEHAVDLSLACLKLTNSCDALSVSNMKLNSNFSRRFIYGLVPLSFFPLLALGQNLPTFTDVERLQQKQNVLQISATASACLENTYQEHLDFYKKWHVSKFYGNRKPDLKTKELRRAALHKYGAPEELVDQLEAMSCIGLTLRCLGAGFQAAHLEPTWKKIFDYLSIDNKFLGTDLQKMLHELGWQSIYWNPDPSQNEVWDLEDRKLNPLKPGKTWMAVWGGHAARYATVINKHNYFNIPIDDLTMLTGFKKNPPMIFRQEPFFVGTAHAGYHVFPGFHGRVIEAHSSRPLNSVDNLQVSEFNPLEQRLGGPKWSLSEHYRSGVIVVPPDAN